MEKVDMKNVIAAIGILLLVMWTYFMFVAFLYPEISSRGLFGDMFGGINALFSGLAFFGVIYAIFLQRKELQLQRKELQLQRDELKLTRKELSRTAEAQEKSEEALSKQATSLKITAKLNGLSAMLRHHDASKTADRFNVFSPEGKAGEIYQEIQKIIEGK